MALVGDIQLQDSAVKPPALDTSQKFSAEGLTATTAFAVTDGGAGTTVSTTGLFTAKSSNDVNAWLQTTKADGNAALYLNNDADPYWKLKVSGTASDNFLIAAGLEAAAGVGEYVAMGIGTAGAVGIGKSAASNILDITYANSATGGVVLTESTNSITTKFISEASSGSIGTTTNNKFGFRTNSATVAAFDTSGNFGIGTDAPGATLDVRGAAIFNEAGAAVDFRIEGDTEANLFFVDGSADNIGIGTNSADGLTHIYGGAAGAVAADSTACNLVVENSAAGGISILTPNASAGSLVFGSPADALGAEIKHTQSTTTMEVGTKETGGILKLNSADGTNAIYIDASQNVGIGTATPGVPLRVQGNACFTGTICATCISGGGSSVWETGTNIIYTTGNCVGIGTATPDNAFHVYTGSPGTTPAAVSTSHDDIVIEAGGSAGITIQVPDTGIAAIALGSCSSSSPAELAWDYDGNTNGLLTLGTNKTNADVRIMSAACNETIRLTNGCVGIGTTTPAAQVELKIDQNATTTFLTSNGTAGTAGAATLQIGADANSGKLQALSSLFTTSNAAIADAVLLEAASTASGGLQLSAAGANELALWTNDNRRVTVTSAGCVGIGTATTSNVILKVQGDQCNTGAITASGTITANNFCGSGATDNIWVMCNCDAIFICAPSGQVGIGTATTTALLTLNGTYSSGANGPNIEFFGTATDAYPSMQILNYSHDDQSINFDNYYDGAWKSSDAGSNFQIRKGGDKLTLRYDSGIAAGSTLTWNTGFVMDTSGNVGIGTASPTYPLEISASDGTSLAWQRTGGSAKKWGFVSDDNASYFRNITDTVDAITVANAGNIGIGTTSPDTLLHLKSSGSGEPKIKIENTNADQHQGMIHFYKTGSSPADADAIGSVAFYADNSADEETLFGDIKSYTDDVTDGTEDGSIKFRTITAGTLTDTMSLVSGNVGIGTNSPSTDLEIMGPAADFGYLTLSTAETTIVNTDPLGRIDFKAPLEASGSNAVLPTVRLEARAAETFDATHNQTDLLFLLASDGGVTEKIRITSAGNVGIGTSAPFTKLSLVTTDNTGLDTTNLDAGSNENTLFLNNSSSTNGTGSAILARGNNTNAAIGFLYKCSDHSEIWFSAECGGVHCEKMRIDSGGCVGIGTATPAAKLDVRGAFCSSAHAYACNFSVTSAAGHAGIWICGTGGNCDNGASLCFSTLCCRGGSIDILGMNSSSGTSIMRFTVNGCGSAEYCAICLSGQNSGAQIDMMGCRLGIGNTCTCITSTYFNFGPSTARIGIGTACANTSSKMHLYGAGNNFYLTDGACLVLCATSTNCHNDKVVQGSGVYRHQCQTMQCFGAETSMPVLRDLGISANGTAFCNFQLVGITNCATCYGYCGVTACNIAGGFGVDIGCCSGAYSAVCRALTIGPGYTCATKSLYAEGNISNLGADSSFGARGNPTAWKVICWTIEVGCTCTYQFGAVNYSAFYQADVHGVSGTSAAISCSMLLANYGSGSGGAWAPMLCLHIGKSGGGCTGALVDCCTIRVCFTGCTCPYLTVHNCACCTGAAGYPCGIAAGATVTVYIALRNRGGNGSAQCCYNNP